MSEVHRIGPLRPDASADVVFVHGLGGHWRNTWASDLQGDDEYWPQWIANSLPALEVWSLEYEASRSNWQPGMSLIEHGDQVLEILVTNGFGKRPILFVAHSLGGLVVKSVLRASCDAVDRRATQVAQMTRGVVFFATPNSGARIATRLARVFAWFGPFGQLYRASSLVQELQDNRPELLKLNRWYRDRVSDRTSNGLSILNKVFYEKRGLALGLISIVDEASADPGIGGIRPIPVAKDHFSICKLIEQENWLFKSVLQFLTQCLNEAEIANNQPIYKSAQKIIELAVVGKIPEKIRFEIDANIIANNNVTVLITHSDGGKHE